jgi:hypothetical protein
MPLAPELLRAYEKAVYAVFASPGVEFRVGEPSDILDAMMAMNRVRTAAFVSSATARGEPSTDNQRKLEEFLLRSRVADVAAQHKYRVYQGEGRDPRGKWKPEPSVLIMGMSREEAAALGRQLEQNAVVFIEKGRAPELLVLV